MGKKMAARRQFVVCVRNEGYAVSLELRKIYVAIPDAAASARGQVRVVDESGEDYLFPPHLFLPITLSESVRKAMMTVV